MLHDHRFVRTLVIFLIFGSFLLAPIPALASRTPMDVIKAGTEKALDILHDRNPDGKLNLRARRGEILTIVDQYFDFEEMAKRSLGRAWRFQSKQKQDEFVRLFKDLLFNTYVDRVESYTASNEQVVFDTQQIDGNHAVVKTRITGYQDKDVSVDYRLTQKAGEWKVYDVIVAGISLVNNYRSQFNSILSRKSFDELLKTMNNKVASINKPA
ncbi:MlaC/ttg2D family ABC transporter substrate-binding protein [Desulfoferrobacter suflitae]|uniref:MlaC/ttg2D family ABC transporter substrate-binding protein n=1 Tax=Desulfoferrobacter suflitae TaxID=2865782 RepID=UPI00216443B9|nr:ABC transporter substrate-binding protein [Desulfoferrobacter suflitae]MCK8602570.1 ABC transporter substrate-binding protein [Desulfoferrobacter suflitae]